MGNRLPMVGWYDPGQLARTAVEVLVSTMFGRHADHRVLEALGRHNFDPHDYSQHEDGRPRGSIWVDYVGDVGDGWNSTYAVAYALAQPTLALTSGGEAIQAPRGDVLVFGGDQVYPTASNTAYRERLVAPYEAALRRTPEPHPDAFAIPGNHDWYDSLVSFTRQFCSRRWLGGWRTRQTCSYFALKLPHGWWLLGTDVQLGSDVDAAQVEFFRTVQERMGPDDRVILCHSEPHWITSAVYEKWDPDASERNLVYLEEKVLGGRVRVFIAGDLHHYRRHEAPDGTQKITCGGGGAFLHPTHGPDVRTIDERDLNGRVRRTFRLAASYPSWWRSWWLTWRNLAFPALNPQLAMFTAAIYVLVGWAVIGPIEGFGRHTLAEAVQAIGIELSHRVGMSLVLVGLIAAVVLFTDTHSKLQRGVGGILHGLTHLGAMLVAGWVGARMAEAWWPDALHEWIGTLAGLALGGAVAAPVILGLYLLISLNLLRRHGNEAFSSLRIQDWKSFLRLHIDERGVVRIYPIGIRRVPRRWRAAGDPGGLDTSELVPDDARWTPPALIESPITMTRGDASAEPGPIARKSA
jgi:Calcineurin-like phosphoesterase